MPGNRGLWLKTKCLNDEEFIVVGWTDRKGVAPIAAAHLVGLHRDSLHRRGKMLRQMLVEIVFDEGGGMSCRARPAPGQDRLSSRLGLRNVQRRCLGGCDAVSCAACDKIWKSLLHLSLNFPGRDTLFERHLQDQVPPISHDRSRRPHRNGERLPFYICHLWLHDAQSIRSEQRVVLLFVKPFANPAGSGAPRNRCRFER
jgi:hypothetical protein